MIPCLSPNGETSFESDEAPTRLLIGSTGGTILLRRDGPGQSWREESRALGGRHIGALLNLPGGLLLAGCHTGGGLFRSADGGLSWTPIGQEINATDIFSLARLDRAGGPTILAGTEPVNLYCSDDLGDHWHERPSIARQPGGELWTFPPMPHVPHLKAIAIDRSAPQTFYACVEQGALLKTEDGGQSWIELDGMWRDNDFAYRDAHRMIVVPWNPRLLIFASGIGVYRSTDAGASWTRCDEISERTRYPDVLVASPRDRAIFVGGPVDVPGHWPGGDPTGTLSRSMDDGLSWQSLPFVMRDRANFEALSIVTHRYGYTLFAGDTMGRIFSSDNAGETWQTIGTVPPISKGAHYQLAAMSARLPRWAGTGLTILFEQITWFTKRRAAAKRRAEFANR